MSHNYVPFAVLPAEGLDLDRLPMELRRHVANGHQLYAYGSYENCYIVTQDESCKGRQYFIPKENLRRV